MVLWSPVTTASQHRPATLESLLALADGDRYEIINGELTEKEAASGKHGRAQVRIARGVGPYDRKPGPPDRPGGWWFATEALVAFGPEHLYRPDVAGWKRERLPEMPDTVPITVLPDWVCEIISPSRPATDLVQKRRTYHRCQIPHYWLIDPRDETMTVLRFTPEGYLEVLIAERGERVRPEPFNAIELSVGVLFGDDE